MLALSHVILHVGFCGAIARAPADTTVALRVHLSDRTGRLQTDHMFRVERGDENGAIVEFDNAFGLYRIDVAAPKYRCSATDYLFFITGRDRSVTEKLDDAPAPLPPKPALLSGEAPQSFLYVQPTFVLFDKGAVACNKPLPEPLSTQISVENDQDSYYTWLYADPAVAPELAAAHAAPADADAPIPLRARPDRVSGAVERLASDDPVQRHARHGRLARRRPDQYVALPETLGDVGGLSGAQSATTARSCTGHRSRRVPRRPRHRERSSARQASNRLGHERGEAERS